MTKGSNVGQILNCNHRIAMRQNSRDRRPWQSHVCDSYCIMWVNLVIVVLHEEFANKALLKLRTNFTNYFPLTWRRAKPGYSRSGQNQGRERERKRDNWAEKMGSKIKFWNYAGFAKLDLSATRSGNSTDKWKISDQSSLKRIPAGFDCKLGLLKFSYRIHNVKNVTYAGMWNFTMQRKERNVANSLL